MHTECKRYISSTRKSASVVALFHCFVNYRQWTCFAACHNGVQYMYVFLRRRVTFLHSLVKNCVKFNRRDTIYSGHKEGFHGVGLRYSEWKKTAVECVYKIIHSACLLDENNCVIISICI